MTMAQRSTPATKRDTYTPESLLAVAVEVFNERGYDGTSMEHLSRAAGISKSSIYHHVRGKEDLLHRAVGRALDGLFGILEESVRQFGVHVMFPDFEGYLRGHGCQELFNEAEKAYGRNKILQSRYVAELMPYVPRELETIVLEVTERQLTEGLPEMVVGESM